MQEVGDDTFWNQVRKRISHPFGMTSFQPDYQWKKICGRAAGYRKVAGKIGRSTDTDVSWKLGGGGFIFNVEDLG